MFAQIFESDPPQYELAPAVPGPYNNYLVTPPRIYGETITGVEAFFCVKENTLASLFTISAYCTMNITTFPGFSFSRFRFDGYTGAYMDRTDIAVGSAFDHQIYQSRDGSLWRKDVTGPVFEVDPLTFEEIDGTRQDPAKYGTSSLDLPMVDRSLDLIVMRSGNEEISNEIGVYDFTSGALIRQITISGEALVIMPEDERRCYVACANHVLNLVDYTTGRVLSTLRTPGAEAGVLNVRYAWDRLLRRFLVFNHRSDDTDGACLSTASGYYPLPLGVGMTPPIPIRAPRAGRSTPFISRVYGDAGEGVPGVKVTPAVGTAALSGAPPFTDRDGEALITLIPDAAGSDTLTVTSDV